MMVTVDKIKQIIAGLSTIALDEIELKDSLNAIGIDSLKLVELVIALENGLGVTFSDSELDPNSLRTVDDIIRLANDYVERKK